jgi:predicted AAA+ superfamily ATPase
MSYLPRIADLELRRKLEASGAVLIRGPKACGKTETASQVAQSVLYADRDQSVPLALDVAPHKLLEGATPRLIDEWQVVPKIWDHVRHEVDARRAVGQFILTGSSSPEEQAKLHSGSGRFTVVDMRTMSWQELGLSRATVSLGQLLNGGAVEWDSAPTDIELITAQMVKGGFPALKNRTVRQAMDVNRAYIELLAEVELSAVSKVRRDPVKVRSTLNSLARNTATLADSGTLGKDIRANEAVELSRPTLYDYLDALERLMVVEDQPAWRAHLRSSVALRNSSKRHFTDVSLAAAALGASPDALLDDLNYTGFLFESMVVHDIRVYAQANDARVYHYRDAAGREIDIIVQKDDGTWCAFEVKLGTTEFDEAASNLLRLKDSIDPNRGPLPASLNIITGTGITHTRKDGVNVIALASLGV